MHSNFLTTYTDLIYEGSRLGGKLTSAAKIINYWTELLKDMGFVFNFEYSDKSLAESATDFRLKFFSGDKQNFAFLPDFTLIKLHKSAAPPGLSANHLNKNAKYSFFGEYSLVYSCAAFYNSGIFQF